DRRAVGYPTSRLGHQRETTARWWRSPSAARCCLVRGLPAHRRDGWSARSRRYAGAAPVRTSVADPPRRAPYRWWRIADQARSCTRSGLLIFEGLVGFDDALDQRVADHILGLEMGEADAVDVLEHLHHVAQA